MQASYISSLLACVFVVSVVKGERWKKSEAGRVEKKEIQTDRRLRREKNEAALTADFQTACRLEYKQL